MSAPKRALKQGASGAAADWSQGSQCQQEKVLPCPKVLQIGTLFEGMLNSTVYEWVAA